MESILYRYRNITVLLVVIFAQIILLAWQIRNDTDVPLVRVWAVTAVTPVASAIENTRNLTTGFFSNYFELRNAREQSHQLKTEVDKLRLENQLLRNDLSSAQRAGELAGFQKRTLSKMVGARVIGSTPGANSRSVLIDRGRASGIRPGMAVVVPDGIVGRVVAVFPFASQVLSVTDPGFAAGVESQKSHVHGVLKGVGNSVARVDYVATGQKVEVGELFFTSGEDRIFPKGLLVGKVTSVQEGNNFQDIIVEPSGAESSAEEVLVILDPVHQGIPDAPPDQTPVFLAPDVPSETPPPAPLAPVSAGAPGTPITQTQVAPVNAITTAGKLMDQYKKVGDAQKHVFGEGLPGSKPPDFNLKVPGVNAPPETLGNAAPGNATSGNAAPSQTKPPVAPAAVPASTPTKPPAPTIPKKPESLP
jgi:rod shape-determining protein MreC